MEDVKRSYIAIIPAEVRYDDTLCANAKLMYGEISALVNERGYCWASNAYFAKLYNKSKDSISRWISELEKAGHITVEISSADGNTRKVYLNLARGYGKKTKRVSAKMPKGLGKNAEHNSIDNNILNNINNTLSANAQQRVPSSNLNLSTLEEKKPLKEKVHRADVLQKTVISGQAVAEHLGLGGRQDLVKAFDEYLEYRKEMRFKKYASIQTAALAMKLLKTCAERSRCTPMEIVDQTRANLWQGLQDLKRAPQLKAQEWNSKKIPAYAPDHEQPF